MFECILTMSPNLSFDNDSERLSESLCWSDRRTSPASGDCPQQQNLQECMEKKRDWGTTERCVIPADILLSALGPDQTCLQSRSTLNVILDLKVLN